MRLVPSNKKPAIYVLTDRSKAMLPLWILLVFVFCVVLCRAVLSVPCSLVITCWDKGDLLVLLCVMFSCGFVTFPCGVLVHVWYLIVSIPDLCLLPYFYCCGRRPYLLVLLCVVVSCRFVTFPYGVPDQACYLIVSFLLFAFLFTFIEKCDSYI